MKQEFSKSILRRTEIIFAAVIIIASVFAYTGKSTDIFNYIIPSIAGIYGASIVFYLNKAKIENILRGKQEFLKFKLEAMKGLTAEQAEEIEKELAPIEQALTYKVNSSLEEAVNQNIDLQSY